ncbi:hypothetical protein NQ317_016917, partial [Molorchus minor]
IRPHPHTPKQRKAASRRHMANVSQLCRQHWRQSLNGQRWARVGICTLGIHTVGLVIPTLNFKVYGQCVANTYQHWGYGRRRIRYGGSKCLCPVTLYLSANYPNRLDVNTRYRRIPRATVGDGLACIGHVYIIHMAWQTTQCSTLADVGHVVWMRLKARTQVKSVKTYLHVTSGCGLRLELKLKVLRPFYT